MKKIDTNLYSRQITTFGFDTMSKIQDLRVLIVGMRGLGIEIAKNIVLSGIKELKIYDENIIIINDLGSNFFLSEKNVGKPRDISCLSKIRELNSYVNVDIFRENLEEKIDNFDVIIFTEIMNTNYLFSINELCHKKKVKFIYCLNLGLSCYIFSDFGDEHIIIDPSGKERKVYFIKNIDKSGLITIDQRNGENFELSKGELVKFKEIEGIEELNDGKPRKIKFNSINSFSIEDNISFENYKKGGIVEEIIPKEKKEYKYLKECFYIPYLEEEPEIIDYTKEGRNELLHCALLAIHKFNDNEKKLPEINCQEDTNKVLIYAKSIYEEAKMKNQSWIYNIENFEEEIIKKVARWSKCEISPTCSFLGGIVSQEIIKATGKYIPINQWIWFDFFETVEELKENIDRSLKGTRYDDQIAIYGNELLQKLNKLNIFIVGAGALGCEYLKNFALMGISTNINSKTIITDNDLIETSNLNRQFLFHQKDIRKPKAKIAAERAKIMNNEFKIKDLELLVNDENEEYFNENFWKNQDFILTAVDNKEARKYVDMQCTKFTKTLIDAGTLGTGGNSQVFVPFKTLCYNDLKDIPEPSIPLCTLKNFPSKIEHCIEWALSMFNDFFSLPLKELKKYLNNKEDFYEYVENEESTTIKISKLKGIKNLLELIKENKFENILKQAVEIYNNNYDYNINLLMSEFPEDCKNKDGSLFWSGSKRFPRAIKFDIDNEDCFNFVKYYSILLARSINVEIIEDKNIIKNIIKNINISKYVPPKNKLPTKEEEMDEINSLKNYLNNFDLKIIEKRKIREEKFDKDDDTNYHVYFVNLCSNLRAENYRIVKSDFQRTKIIAGKIIPAIPSTTSAITGFSCMQLFTLVNSDNINLVKNCNLNTAFNLYVIFNPPDEKHMTDEEYNIIFDGPTKAIPPGWTAWDIIDIKGPMTCLEFVEYFQKKYEVKISSISSNSKTIIFMFMPSKAKKINRKIEEIYENDYGVQIKQNYLWLDIAGKQDNIDVIMPKIRYYFK